MPERPGSNPYSRPVNPGDGSAPNPANEFIWAGPGRYSVPDIPESTDPSYQDGAYATELATAGSPNGTPDDIRIGLRKPPPNSPQDDEVYHRRYNEFYQRASVDETDVGWHTRQAKIPAPNVPIWTQERMPIRPTADLAPMPYMFRRPEHHPRNIKDAVGPEGVQHFSMADHRRTWEIMGQRPQGGVGVNTYRAPIRPWDANNFIPPQPGNHASDIFGGKSFRLGGDTSGGH
jgi:hypothetical protein